MIEGIPDGYKPIAFRPVRKAGELILTGVGIWQSDESDIGKHYLICERILKPEDVFLPGTWFAMDERGEWFAYDGRPGVGLDEFLPVTEFSGVSIDSLAVMCGKHIQMPYCECWTESAFQIPATEGGES